MQVTTAVRENCHLYYFLHIRKSDFLLLPIGSLGTFARSATTGTDLSIGDVVSPNLWDHVVSTLAVFGAGG
jgi:hypothetical protein